MGRFVQQSRIYYHHIELRDAISELGGAIQKAEGSDREKSEALRLLNDFLCNPFVTSILGGTDGLL